MTDETRDGARADAATTQMGSDQSGNAPAALVVPGSTAVAEPIVLRNELWAPADPTAYSIGEQVDNTHLAEFGKTDAGRRDDARWSGLLEVIPTPETAPDVVESVRWFADHRLGKGVVIARDTPNFIANHVALYGVMRMIEMLAKGEYTVEEIDAITGPALGRPKSATFRTMDIAGLDVLALVVGNLYERLPAGTREAFAVPPLMAYAIGRHPLPRGAVPKVLGLGIVGIFIGQVAQALGVAGTSASVG